VHDEALDAEAKKKSNRVMAAWRGVCPPPPAPPMILLTTPAGHEGSSTKLALNEVDANFLIASDPELTGSFSITEHETSSKQKKLVVRETLEDEPTLVFSVENTDIYLGSCAPGFEHLRLNNVYRGPMLPMGLRVPHHSPTKHARL
jgi:hypothetical protein